MLPTTPGGAAILPAQGCQSEDSLAALLRLCQLSS